VGFYERRVFPWLNDLANGAALRELRREVLAPARGRVVEIGLGTGANLPLYPAAVSSLIAVEPSGGMLARARARIAAAPFPVEVREGRAEALPLEDGCADTAVSTLTLCTVTDPLRVLAELRRVLRPGAPLLLLEHGLADDPGVARWQHRLNPVQNVVACGCNLDRPVRELVAQGGFRLDSLRTLQLPGSPRVLGWMTLGTAVRA
jgi:ubiquinone/menaquinone biosynthesis C-methylase UbiE